MPAGSSVGSGASAREAPRSGSAVVLVAVIALGASKVDSAESHFSIMTSSMMVQPYFMLSVKDL